MCSKVLRGLLAIVASAVTSTALAGVIILFERQNFQGTQMVLQGEGQYPGLPGDVSRRISSGRRIADQYPYDAPPNW